MSFKAPTVTEENDQERFFRYYIEELLANGFLESFSREPEVFQVIPDFIHKRVKQYKSKENSEQNYSLLKGANYTYDFRLIWTPKAIGIFTEIFSLENPFLFGTPIFISHYIELNGTKKIVSYVDVKPHASAAQFGGNLSSFYTFPFIQKMLMNIYNIYINKAVPIPAGKPLRKKGKVVNNRGNTTCLFATTFTPNRYLFTDTGSKTRTIHFRKQNINQFVKMRQGVVDNFRKIEVDKFNKNKANNSQQSLL